MIGYLRGEVLEHAEGKMLLLTSVGVGYSVLVPHGPSYGAFLPGSKTELFIHTHVREDALDLFGFAKREEKELFLILLSVNGIGPKSALGILSGVEPGTLIQAILDGDKAQLTRLPGVGKKIAERVVLELADPIAKKVQAGWMRSAGATTGRGDLSSGRLRNGGASTAIQDAREALVGLGYREQDILPLIQRMAADSGAGGTAVRAEELIRAALRELV